MYIKWITLCLINVLTVHGFKFFDIKNGFRNVVEKIQSIAVISDEPISTRWIEQKLDHFDPNETRTWQMRYYERLDLWKTDGPIYLFMGGEFKAMPEFLVTGMVYELAKETKGAMFMSEHRYYGQSQPVQNRSKVEDMKYLSATQALADAEHLLLTIKKKNSFRNSKVVVVGGSYAGNLAAWMRLSYPDLVDAAIASSGPVLAKRDFQEYLEVVNNDYEKYGTPDCLENIKRIFKRYDSLLQSEAGIKQLKEEENICEKSNMTRPENKQLFFLSKASLFMGNAQYGTTNGIEKHCTELNKTSLTFSQQNDGQYYWNQKQDCYDINFDVVLKVYYEKKNDWILCWTYQTCTEFGYFQSSTSDNQPFTKNIPVEFSDKLCMALFGEEFDRERVDTGVRMINERFGGKSPNVTKVVFANGELDPWSALSVLEDLSNEAPAVLIPRSAHCTILFPNEKNDSGELKEARKRIKYLIKNWIGVEDSI